MLAELRNLITGAVNTARGSYDFALVTQDGHARYQEAVMRGNCFAVSDQTGKTMANGLSASPTTVTLYNPKGNNKCASIIYAGLTNIVAPGAASTIWVAVNNNVAAAATTGTLAAPINCQVGNTNLSSIQAVTTATLPAAPVAISVLGVELTGAITTVPQQAALGRFFDGSIILFPGGSLSFQASTTGGASGSFGEWIWEEIPITA